MIADNRYPGIVENQQAGSDGDIGYEGIQNSLIGNRNLLLFQTILS
jgi:hypothetical protein